MPDLVTKSIGVKEVPTGSLKPNPHNPRLLFDREPMDILKASINKVGILVPLTVYRDSNKGHFVILDGQRRWTCAMSLGLPKIPVNEVAEPTLVQNIVTMFQIHKLRQDWELMPTALKLELLMTELHEKNEERLSTLTGLPESVVSRCKKLLSYPKKFQDLMLDPEPSMRIKADFFIELYQVINDREVSKMEWFSRNTFTEQMLKKHGTNKAIRSVTDFRTVKQHINYARKAGQLGEISRRLKEFAEDVDTPLTHLEIETAQAAVAAKKMKTDVAKLTTTIANMDVEQLYGEEDLWLGLVELLNAVQAKLKEADRRF